MKHDWEYKKLGEVAPIICGKDYKSVLQENGQYPIYGSGGIMGYASEYRCPENCTIVGRKGSINNPLFVTTKFWNVDTAFGLNPKLDYINPKYLYYFCTNFDFNTLNVAVTLPSLRRTDVENILISLPPLPTQQSIVSELDSLSKIIADCKETLKDYDALEQSIFYDMFGDPVKNEKGWEVSTYGEEFEIGAGGTPSTKISEYWENGDIPWIGSNMCQNAFVYNTDGKFITKEGLAHSSAKLLQSNTVIVALVGATIGKVGLLKTETSTNQNIAFLKPAKKFTPEYVFYHLMNQYCEFMSIGNGDFKMASQGFIKSLKVCIPPLPLQQQFASKIEAIEKMKSETKKALQEAETLFNARMDYWFN